MSRQFIIGIYFVLFCFVSANAQRSKVVALEKLISWLHEKKWFNGAIVAGENGQIFYKKGLGFADFSALVPFTPLTPSDGGSNAKTLTAAAVLLLAEKNVLQLDDSIQHFFPSYPYPNTSVFNLITHSTGGLPGYDYYFKKIADSASLTTPLMIEILNQDRPVLSYKPGSNFCYDSPGFDIAAAIVEKCSGISFQQFLQSHFFAPLKMDSCFIRPARLTGWKGRRTKGYKFENDSVKPYDIADREGFYGGSNIWFSAIDLYKWGTSFYNKKTVNKNKNVIRKAVSPVSINGKPSVIRLGAWYPGKNADAFYYWGDLYGFYSWVYWDRKRKFTIAFVTNTRTPQWVRPQLTAALIDIMEGKDISLIEEPPSEIINKNNFEAIAGSYKVEGHGKVDILIKKGKPFLQLPSGMEYQMFQVESKTFYVPGLEPWISFHGLENNRFQELLWDATISRITGTRLAN